MICVIWFISKKQLWLMSGGNVRGWWCQIMLGYPYGHIHSQCLMSGLVFGTDQLCDTLPIQGVPEQNVAMTLEYFSIGKRIFRNGEKRSIQWVLNKYLFNSHHICLFPPYLSSQRGWHIYSHVGLIIIGPSHYGRHVIGRLDCAPLLSNKLPWLDG